MSNNSEKVKRWRKRVKERIVNAMGGKCQCCGYDKCVASLDLHHLDPTEKEFGLGGIRANPKSWEKIVPELRKCILVCRNCHGEIHYGEREIPKSFTKFDESYITYKTLSVSVCPVCGKEKESHNKTCSKTCAASLSGRIDWSKYDLKKLFIEEKMTQSQISELVGVSDVSVSKRLKKLGLK